MDQKIPPGEGLIVLPTRNKKTHTKPNSGTSPETSLTEKVWKKPEPGSETKTPEKTSKTETSSRSILAAEILSRFSVIYSLKQGSPDRARKKVMAWTKILEPFTNQEIIHGMKLVKEYHPDFPPNPYQFAKLCELAGVEMSRQRDREKLNEFLEEQAKRQRDWMAQQEKKRVLQALTSEQYESLRERALSLLTDRGINTRWAQKLTTYIEGVMVEVLSQEYDREWAQGKGD